MNWKILSVLIALLASVSCLLGSTFDDANRQFAAGDFSAAAESYGKVLADNGPDAAVYYNLGNSYQSLKQYGPAILAYERARLLTPRDPDLLANLAIARKASAVFDESENRPRLEAVLNYFSRNEWSWLVAGAAMTLGILALLRGVVRLRVPWMRSFTVGLAVLSGIALIFGFYVLVVRSEEASLGIVLKDKSVVRLSPFDKAESLGTTDAGRIVRLSEKSGGFHYVQVPGASLQGWVADEDVAAVTPKVATQ